MSRSPWGGIVAGPALAAGDPVGAYTAQRAANNIAHYHEQSSQVIASGWGASWMTLTRKVGSGVPGTVDPVAAWPCLFPAIGPWWVRVRPDGQTHRVRVKLRAHASHADTRMQLYITAPGDAPSWPVTTVAEGQGRAYWDLPTSDPGTWLSDPYVDEGVTARDHVYLLTAARLAAPVTTRKELGGDHDTVTAPMAMLWLGIDSDQGDGLSPGGSVTVSATVTDFYAAEVAG